MVKITTVKGEIAVVMADHSPLREWNSCPDLLHIPDVLTENVTKLHVYDFDNTLYCSPHPNRQLYTKKLYDRLYNSPVLLSGGWWSEPCFLEESFQRMLKSTGVERADYWNTEQLSLAKQSYEDQDTISIVLTGRKEVYFGSIFNKMFLDFDDVEFNAVCLKRANVGNSTAEYKISLISDFLEHYKSLKELVIYDDRAGQVKTFEKAFRSAEVVLVRAQFKMLDVPDECRLVKEIFERSNKAGSLTWTPKTYGFIVNQASHRALISWTYRFFKKKYKMSALPQYPVYIPLAADTDDEIARIWSNNSAQVMSSPSNISEICDKFRAQQNLEGECSIKFDVVGIGYGTHNQSRRALQVYYKVKASDSKRYISPSSTTLIALSSDQSFSEYRADSRFVKWVSLDRPIKLRSVLGHFARLTTTD